MDEYLTGAWEEFESWIRTTIGGDFRWKIRPQDTASNREIVANLIKEAIKRNNGTFPEKEPWKKCRSIFPSIPTGYLSRR